MYTLTTSENIYMSLTSPFGTEATLTKFEGEEGISSLFKFRFEFVSPKNNLSFKDIVGKSVTASFKNDLGTRYINGIVFSFRQLQTIYQAQAFEQTFYELVVVPTMWNMKLSENCQIFQDMSAMDIIKKVMGTYALEIEDKVTSAGKATMDYMVQFNESDFHFVCRLMEQFGIFYFFIHENGKHTLYLGDDSSAFPDAENGKNIPFTGPLLTQNTNILGVQEFILEGQIFPASYATSSYNFTTPSTSLFAKTTGEGLAGNMYHYPDRDWTGTQSDSESISKVRLESYEAPGTTMSGSSNIPFLTQGGVFTIKGHPRSEINGKSIVASTVRHTAELKDTVVDEGYNEVAGDDTLQNLAIYKNTFTSFPKNTPFKPPITTPIPQIPTQTATVTGKAGEEIWTDKYGRIKVKFHWDQSGTTDDKTTCWIRVMQHWTGNQWGFVFIPRIGQEVVVQFINGLASHPLVTGCVYNEENMPPYLPDEPTKSTIKTNSTKGGGGFNELRLDDKKGSEQVYIHAQKDMDTMVLANKTTTVQKGNREITIQEGNYTNTLQKGNETKTLQNGNRTVMITGNQDHTTTKNYTHKVQGNYELDVTGNATTKVQGNYELDVTGNATTKVQGNVTSTVQGNVTETITGNANITISGNCILTVTGNTTITPTGPMMISCGAAITMTDAAGCTITSNAAVTISGQAGATFMSSAMVTITGSMVGING